MAEYKGTGASIGEGESREGTSRGCQPTDKLNCPEGQGDVSQELGMNISGGRSVASLLAQAVKNLSPAMQESQV